MNKKIRRITQTKQSIDKTLELIRKYINKGERGEKVKRRIERLKVFNKNLEKVVIWDMEQVYKITEEVKEIRKNVISLLGKEKRKFKNKKFNEHKTRMRDEGWGNKSEFYNKALGKNEKKPKINRIPDRLLEELKEEGIEVDPFDPEKLRKW
jgi:2'-5' RNA ligase